MPTDEPVLFRATVDQLDLATLYAVLRLRVEVFVVEQACAYQELDGHDLESATLHLWLAPRDAPTSVLGYLRLLTESDGYRIGRVCTAPTARGRGLADVLVRAALEEIGSRPCVLAAQSRLVGFYRRHGFVVAGQEYVEDAIPHVPMRLKSGG